MKVKLDVNVDNEREMDGQRERAPFHSLGQRSQAHRASSFGYHENDTSFGPWSFLQRTQPKFFVPRTQRGQIGGTVKEVIPPRLLWPGLKLVSDFTFPVRLIAFVHVDDEERRSNGRTRRQGKASKKPILSTASPPQT